MSAGSAHSLYVSEEGALFATGDRSAGKLGLGSMDADAPPEQLTPARVRFGRCD
jgi:alpha-tubulin suppressor-like RCC1 family protein